MYIFSIELKAYKNCQEQVRVDKLDSQDKVKSTGCLSFDLKLIVKKFLLSILTIK